MFVFGRRNTVQEILPEPAGSLDTPVAGVRIWLAAERWRKPPVLRSLIIYCAGWKSATETAVCRRHRTSHPAPAESCECGLYAYWRTGEDLMRAIASAPRVPNSLGSCGVVLGAVVGWGDRVVLHPEGWRAHHAKLVALADPGAPAVEPEDARSGASLVRSLFTGVGQRSLWAPPAILERLAEHYRVGIVPLSLIDASAAEHGQRLDLTGHSVRNRRTTEGDGPEPEA